MADVRLLKIIDSLADDRTGDADGKKVSEAYGAGFDKAFREAYDDDYIDRQGSVGSIRLSRSGRELARQ